VVLSSWNINNFDVAIDASLQESVGELIVDKLSSIFDGAIEVEEVVGWIGNLVLGLSLYWKSLLSIANLDIVSSFDSDSVSILISFHKWLTNSLVVIAWSSAILHKFDSSWGD
jgi:hypothetical protein